MRRKRCIAITDLAKDAWLLQGDANTKYLYKIANGKRRKNMMYSLIERQC